MAWNEPGNNGEKDPWGSRQDQGPPDLDEAFKKLKDNLGGMFGGGSGAGKTRHADSSGLYCKCRGSDLWRCRVWRTR